jgi:hypothetical protein
MSPQLKVLQEASKGPDLTWWSTQAVWHRQLRGERKLPSYHLKNYSQPPDKAREIPHDRYGPHRYHNRHTESLELTMPEILVVCKKCGQMLTLEYAHEGGEVHIEKCADIAIVLVHRPHREDVPTCNTIFHSFSCVSNTTGGE